MIIKYLRKELEYYEKPYKKIFDQVSKQNMILMRNY